MYSGHWTLEEISYRQFIICHELPAVAGWSPIQQLSRTWHSHSLFLQALLMVIGSPNLFQDMGFWGPNIQVSQNEVKSALEAF
jgi:hypothetical protein